MRINPIEDETLVIAVWNEMNTDEKYILTDDKRALIALADAIGGEE